MGKGKGRFVLFVVFFLLLLGAGSAGAIVWGLQGVADEIRTAPGFATGWARAVQSPLLNDAVGPPQLAPFNLVEFVKGRQSWRFTASHTSNVVSTENAVRTIRQEHNEIEVPIQGPRGTGSLTMETSQSGGGTWEIKKLAARIDGRADPIDLLEQGP